MSEYLLGAFVLACVVLAITPGPAMALLIANSTRHGKRAGLHTVLGNGLGLTILVAAATLGLTSVMTFVAQWFDVIRWIGAAYLVWLGLTRLRSAWQQPGLGMSAAADASRERWFWQGLAVALSNPKVLLFLGAFFPQFLDPAAAVGPQLAILAITFVAVIMLMDALMALAADSARNWFMARGRVLDGFSGGVLICGAIWLAMTRRA
ncbi:MAG: LysE family translocator [Dichotomicrobium sp.]